MGEGSFRSSVEERINHLLVSKLKVDTATIAATGSSTPLLGRGIGLDSVEILALVVFLEQEFDISVPDSELTLDLFKDIGTLTDYILRNISEKSAIKSPLRI